MSRDAIPEPGVHAFSGEAVQPAASSLRAAFVSAFGETNAPRYTSYPTAVQFSPAVNGKAHRDWLASLPETRPVSLYLHIPFCRRLCWYCGCAMKVSRRPEPIAAYADVLSQEIDQTASAIGRRLGATAVHLGGGSPDSLSAEDLRRIFEALRRGFAFDDDVEIAAELDPAFVSSAWIDEAGRLGLRRASLGVQTLAPHVQHAVHRPLEFARLKEAFSRLRAAGAVSLNIDLMYGLPDQTLEDIEDTLDLILTLEPDRLAVFGYAHVPSLKPHQRIFDPKSLPGAEARLEQALAAAQRLEDAGYRRIGLDHFARPHDALARVHAAGGLRRNFQGYTTDDADSVIGMGMSAISRLPQGYTQNTADLTAWRDAVIENRAATARGVAFAEDDLMRAEAIERLMCDGSLDLADLLARRPVTREAEEGFWRDLQAHADRGLVTLEAGRVRVTDSGAPLVRTICTAFDRYFDAQGGRHSRAI
jgi:oxygen-independent coproporphyrinogen-3 oxidase